MTTNRMKGALHRKTAASNLEDKANLADKVLQKVHDESGVNYEVTKPRTAPEEKRTVSSISIYPSVSEALEMAVVKLKTEGKKQRITGVNKSFIIESLVKILSEEIDASGMDSTLARKILEMA